MKCDNCPARSKADSWTGCLALKHSIQDYNGCNRAEEQIRNELAEWFQNASESEIAKFSFWKSDGLRSCWVSAARIKGENDEKN